MIDLASPIGWDAIDPNLLLPLLGVRRMSREFGWVMRPYWMPWTELTYRRSIHRTVAATGSDPAASCYETIVQRPARCDADTFWWRETVLNRGGATDGFARFLSTPSEEHFCIYDRSEQTFRTRAITGRTMEPEDMQAARIQAFLRQPILMPLLPIPVGFRWHVAADNGYMEFVLESQTVENDMPVLFVRRHGKFEAEGIGAVERTGMTAYASERSIVLEDRTHDRVSGTETWTVTNLVKSAAFTPSEEE